MEGAQPTAELAAEFVSRLMHDRRSLAAIALTTDTSALTAIGNELCADLQAEALGRPGDLFVGTSTSDNSKTWLRLFEHAERLVSRPAGLTGAIGWRNERTVRQLGVRAVHDSEDSPTHPDR